MSVLKAAKRMLFDRAAASAQLRRERQLLSWFDFAADDVKRAADADPAAQTDCARILIPRFEHPYGGVFTAFRLADAINRAGAAATISVYDAPQFDMSPHLPLISRRFPTIDKSSFVPFEPRAAFPGTVVATFWPSAYHALKMDAKRRVHLIQDFEPLFYPAGVEYALCENTYRFPAAKLANTVGLLRFIQSSYPNGPFDADFFTPCADAPFAPAEKALQKPYRVLVYARPNAPRNAFALTAAFSRELKRRYGSDVEITAAGAALTRRERACFGGSARFAGVVPYDELPAFYSRFHFALALMFTKHPSYIPIEAMACGVFVIVNKNSANEWLFKNCENCITADASVTALTDAFNSALDAKKYRFITKNAALSVRTTDWETEMKRAACFVLGH